ncbi:MAG: hypothetical protein HZA01_04975 [Nitrospinae bacterium]|nr:hypothetical protein [Nitrospinota bacterium]
MPQTINFFLVTLLLIVFLPAAALGGAWTERKGRGYNKLAFNYYHSDKNYDTAGNKADAPFNGDFRDANVSIYADYGITDELTVLLSAFYKSMRYMDDNLTEHTDAFGDPELALKYKLGQYKNLFASFQAGAKFPGLYGKRGPLPSGNHQIDIEPRLLLGVSLYPITGYLNLEAAYRYRAEEPADEFRYLLEAGYSFTQDIGVRCKLDIIESARNGAVLAVEGMNKTITYQYDLYRVELSGIYRLAGGWSLELTCNPTFHGKNTSHGTAYSMGLVWVY